MEEDEKSIAKLIGGMAFDGIQQDIDSLVYPLLNDTQRTKYDQLRSLQKLHLKFMDEGLIFSWEEARKRGWLCEYDYAIFSELTGFDPYEYYDERTAHLIKNIKARHREKELITGENSQIETACPLEKLSATRLRTKLSQKGVDLNS